MKVRKFLKNLSSNIRSAKQDNIEKHLNWSKYKPDKFLSNLQEQNVRYYIFKRIKDIYRKEGLANILEIGFGSAADYKRMKSFFITKNIHYTGLDYTDHFVKEAKKKYPKAKWIKGDICKLPFNDNSYDVIFLYHVLEHQKGLRDVEKAIIEMTRVARNKIIIIWFKAPSIVDSTKHWKTGDFFVYKYSASDIWKIVFKTDFIVKEIVWENPWHNTVWILEKRKHNKNVESKKKCLHCLF